MKLTLCALGISIAIICPSTMANTETTVKSAKNVAEMAVKDSTATTTSAIAKTTEKNVVQIEMHKMKDAMAILRTTKDNETAWDAIIDLRYATIELIENIPLDIKSDTTKKDSYLAILKKLEALTFNVEHKLNQDKLSEIQPLLNEIDKVKLEGHQIFKK
jgi:uncharacterized protein with FMN-binding domain